jgi:hypothetical protein
MPEPPQIPNAFVSYKSANNSFARRLRIVFLIAKFGQVAEYRTGGKRRPSSSHLWPDNRELAV